MRGDGVSGTRAAVRALKRFGFFCVLATGAGGVVGGAAGRGILSDLSLLKGIAFDGSRCTR